MSACQYCGGSFPRMYQLGDGSIMCLNCYSKYQTANASAQRGMERMMNYLMDEAEWAVGIPLHSPRFPEPKAPVHMHNPTLNSVNINNSVVGAINQGSVESMNVSLSNITQSNSKEAQLIKSFTELLLQSEELQKEQKEEILDQLVFLTNQLTKPKEQRQHKLISTMVGGITTALKGTKFLLELWLAFNGIFGAQPAAPVK